MGRALEREGPDNVTVVVARFDGAGLPDPRPEELVDFVPYDPGYDPSEPPRVRNDLAEKVTVEVTVPKEAIRLTGSGHEAIGAAARGTQIGLARRRPGEANAMLSFLLVTLLAATAAGAFVHCDRSRTREREEQAAAAAAAAAADEGSGARPARGAPTRNHPNAHPRSSQRRLRPRPRLRRRSPEPASGHASDGLPQLRRAHRASERASAGSAASG